MDWQALGAIAGIVSAGAAVIGLIAQARRGRARRTASDAPRAAETAPASPLETTTPDELSRWAEWAWDHGTPRDQERARELMGYGEFDPAWEKRRS